MDQVTDSQRLAAIRDAVDKLLTSAQAWYVPRGSSVWHRAVPETAIDRLVSACYDQVPGIADETGERVA